MSICKTSERLAVWVWDPHENPALRSETGFSPLWQQTYSAQAGGGQDVAVRKCLLSVFAMVLNGVDTCRVPLCWHASRCPRHRRGRCLFRHRDVDADVKPSRTRTEEEMGAEELAVLWRAVGVDVACGAECRRVRAAGRGRVGRRRGRVFWHTTRRGGLMTLISRVRSRRSW